MAVSKAKRTPRNEEKPILKDCYNHKRINCRLRDSIMDSADFLTKVTSAVKDFYRNDSELITLQTERPIAHRVALYLEPLFKEKNVDCEYKLEAHFDGWSGNRRRTVAGIAGGRTELLMLGRV